MTAPIIPIEDLIEACRIDYSNVMIWEPALDGANYFGLLTKSEIKKQIGNGFLEKWDHESTKPLQNWPSTSGSAPIVEAYNFHAGTLYGYVAYFYVKKTKKWSIKSLKKNDNHKLKNFAFKDNPELLELKRQLTQKGGKQ